MIPLPLAEGYYTADSEVISAMECTNWFPVREEAAALSEWTLRGTPGLTQVDINGAEDLDACRGAWVMNGIAYFVNRTTLYRLNSDETTDSLGTISGTGRVSMSDNGTQLMVLVPGGDGYIFVEPSTLTTISDADFTTANGAPQYVTFIDSYFVCTTDENKFIHSNVNDGLTWTATDFGSAESATDGVVVPFVYKNQLFVAGERTIEGFANIGEGADFAFQRSGLFLDEGVMSPFSVAETDEATLFIGGGKNEGPAVWALSGNNTVRVSTHAIDRVLEGLTIAELEAVFSWVYSEDGHYFIGFTLPTTTFVYDMSTKLWHERSSAIQQPDTSYLYTRSRINAVVKAYGALYVGDNIDGRIGKLSSDTYTEYGEEIRRCVAGRPFANQGEQFSVPALELTIESGVGDATTTDPQIRMQYSRDGGKTWSNERSRSMGAQGDYRKRQIWRRLGRFDRFAVFRFLLSDPVKPVIAKLEGEFA